MAARLQCRFLFVLLTLSIAAILQLQAQINGVPPSVTSIGFGGRFINGVPPSVTSLGPNGYPNSWPIFGNCCANLFSPANPNPLLTSGHHHRHRDRASLAGAAEAVYIPYVVPYDQEIDGEAADADDAPDMGDAGAPANRAVDHDLAPQGAAFSSHAAGKPVEPVSQPSTVLVFKDGYRADVVNYAIVGDTLFVFAAGRTRKILLADLDLSATHKANDDRGVDFQIPAGVNVQ